ncbi:DinB family protein [Hazenella coriacea]|nr:DinB family protein [Hazenella coriacea]
MYTLFRYNWQVRDDWFQWCKQLSDEELRRERTGGVGNILHTLFHIVYVEQSWICDLQGRPELHFDFDSSTTLQQVEEWSSECRPLVEQFVSAWSPEMEMHILTDTHPKRPPSEFRYGEVLRHVIAHEIHHMGQLSVWARELQLQPISANLIRRGLYE